MIEDSSHNSEIITRFIYIKEFLLIDNLNFLEIVNFLIVYLYKNEKNYCVHLSYLIKR